MPKKRIKIKAKGTYAERELFHMFWESGWGCARVAGSGSTRRPSTDLVAGNASRLLAVECKSISQSAWYFAKDEIEKLATFAASFGAEPWVAIRFDNIGWYFVHLNNLKESKGESFVVSIKFAEKYGLNFDEMIGKYRQEKIS